MIRQFVFGMSQLSRAHIRVNTYVRVFTILMVLILAGAFGALAKPKVLGIVLLLVGGGCFLVVFLRRLEWLILLTIPLSFFIPIEVATGTNIRLNATFMLSIIFIAIWLYHLLFIEKRVLLVPSIVNKPAIVFICVVTLSLFIGNLKWFIKVQDKASFPAQLGGWALYVVSIGVFLAIGNLNMSQSGLKKIVSVYILISILPFIALLIPWVSDYVTRVYVPVSLTSLTRVWLTSLAFGQLLWMQRPSFYKKLGLGLCSFIPLLQSWLYDREFVSGWLPVLTAIYVLVWLRSCKWGMALTLIGVLVLAINSQNFIVGIMTPTQQYSTESRMATWPVMLELIKTSPLFGLGLANYPYFTHLFPIYGYFIRFNSHNNYVDIVAQTGIIGLISFTWLAISIARLGWRLRYKVSDPFSQGFVNGAIAGLVGTLSAGFMADWFLPFLYNIGFPGFRASLFAWIFLGGLISLEQIVNKDEKSSALT